MNENIDSGAFSPDFDNELNLKKMELEKVKAEEERLTTRIRTLQQNLIDLETKETSRLSSFKSLYSKEKELLLSDVENLKREKQELEEKNSELADSVSQNETKLLKLLSDLSAKTKLVASLDTYLPQLDSSMHEKEREFNRILREIDLNDEKLSHLLKRLEHVNREFEIKKLQLDSYESSLLNTQTLLSELEGKVTKYDGLKNEIFRNIKNSIQKESSLKEKIARLEKHLDTLESNRFEIESNLLKAEENFISMAATFKEDINSVKIKHREISKKLIDKELTLFKKTEEIVRKEKLLTGLEIEFRAVEYRIKVASEEVQTHAARKLKLQEEILQLSGEKIKL
jgi:chromosome segregation ATPase